MDLMKTYDSLTEHNQDIVNEMSNNVRLVLQGYGIKPLNDDRAAIFDEACAVYLLQSLNANR